MRPTDENQAASTRPNLMSSRRGAGEDNILAMLERDSARRSGSRLSSPRLAWYCVAAAFSGIVVGVVAWLAYDRHTTPPALQVEAERVIEDTAGTPAIPPLADGPAPTQLAEAPRAAVIVDQPQDKPAAPPPLVMLPPEEAGANKAAAPIDAAPAAPVGEAVEPPPPLLAPKTTQPDAGTAAVRTVEADKNEKAPKPEKAEKVVKLAKAGKTTRPEKAEKAEKAGKVAKSEKAPRSAARTVAKPPAQRKAAADKAQARKARSATAPATETAVDSDVALISAIIAQSERHRGERQQAAPCTGPKCPPPPKP